MPTKFYTYFSYSQSMGDPAEYNIWRHLSRTKKELVCVVEGLTEAKETVNELLVAEKQKEMRS